MMPFSEENKIVEEALQNVFEAEPYWFDLILARDRTLRRNLFENVKAHMELVDGFCADISDLNPNVMLELGMTENDSRERPVLVLRREGSKDPPSDLKGRLYVEYSLPGPEVADRVQRLTRELRQKLSEIEDVEQLLQRRQARYLSTDHIRKVAERVRLVLKDDEIRQLQKAFTTIEELESAEAALVARRAGFDTDLASAIAKAFRPKTKKPVR
jgi:hypothetical protein